MARLAALVPPPNSCCSLLEAEAKGIVNIQSSRRHCATKPGMVRVYGLVLLLLWYLSNILGATMPPPCANTSLSFRGLACSMVFLALAVSR